MLIAEHQSKWVQDFAQIKAVIQSELKGIGIEVEHFGSTSVKHLPAKPIIDIDIIFFELEDFERIKSGLQNVGYYHNGDQGIAGREAFKRDKQKTHSTLDTIPHHLYVCHTESRELKRHLLFRDHLRTNKDARETYASIKYELAKKANEDKKAYALLKESGARDFINQCIRKQEKINGN